MKRKKIEAKIIDFDWIKLFRSRQVSLGPGDALRVDVEVETRYDLNREVISITYTISEVFEVIPMASAEQLSIEEIENIDEDF